METIEAIYENGQVQFTSPKLPKRKYKVLVTFLEEIEEKKDKSSNKMSGKAFIQKWAGIIEGVDIENYKEERIKYLREKYK